MERKLSAKLIAIELAFLIAILAVTMWFTYKVQWTGFVDDGIFAISIRQDTSEKFDSIIVFHTK